MRDKKNVRGLAALLAAVTCALSTPLTALAVQPTDAQVGAIAADHAEKSQDPDTPVTDAAALTDNVLEFGEIRDRVLQYNVTYKNTKSTILGQALNLQAGQQLARESAEMFQDARDVKDEDKLLYEEYKAMAVELRKEAQRLTNQELSSPMKTTLRHAGSNLIKVAQDLVIQYKQTAVNEETLKQSVELAKENLTSQERMKAIGMAGEADVLAARQQLLSAQNQLAQLQSGMETMRQSINILLGWKADDQITFADIPDPDGEFAAHTDREADIQTAIGANYTLTDALGQKAAGNVSRVNRRRTVSTTRQTVRGDMEALYTQVVAKQQAFCSADTAWQASDHQMQAAERQKSLGMLSRLQYGQIKTGWISAKAARENARLAWIAAAQNYEWAKKGLIAE